MNMLAAVMPGVRDARTPLAIGGLWIACAVFALLPTWPSFVESNNFAEAAFEAWQRVLPVYQAVLVAFSAYVLGLALSGLSSAYSRSVLHFSSPPAHALRKLALRDGRLRKGRLARWTFRASNVLTNSQAFSSTSGPLFDAVRRRYSDEGLPPEASQALPDHLMHVNLQSTDLQLWHRAPEQYAEYDRLRAEEDFRIGVSLPLAALAVVLGIHLSWALAALLVVGSFVLVFLGRKLENERRTLLASAVNEGLTNVPVLAATVRFLASLNLPRDASHMTWLAATAVGLRNMGEYEGAQQCTWEMAREVIWNTLSNDEHSNLLSSSSEDILNAAKAIAHPELELFAEHGGSDLIIQYAIAVEAEADEFKSRMDGN